MNTLEIAFIICKNNLLWYEECIRYIQDLYVPEGFGVDIITIEEAESVSAAYHAAMISSKAKYKVYLQQDVFILHRDFITDILKIFQEDDSVGMIGMTGCRSILADTECHDPWDAGRVFMYDGMHVQDLDLRNDEDKDAGYTIVEAVDSFLIVTQYDHQWQAEEADGQYPWYISWSVKMCKSGRKIVVPWQEEPWCYYDCGVETPAGFDTKRLKKPENEGGFKELYLQLTRLAETGAFDAIWTVVDEIRDLPDREIRAIANLAEIHALEKASIQGIFSQWWMVHNWSGMYEYYNQIRFALLRMEYQRQDGCTELMKKMVKDASLHRDAVLHLASHTLPCMDRVYNILLKKGGEEPLVSVVLPVYNGAGFVGRTIESILNQTYKNIELIIVDDASTDHSREVIQSYTDFRIRTIFCEKNRNVVYSGNLGFEEAKGKYVALIGHDDIWKADKLEKQVAFLEEHPSYGVCFSYMDVIDENLKVMKDSFFYHLFSKRNQTAEAWIRKLFMEGNCFCAPSACIRKTLLDEVGYYRYALVQLQDYDLWLRLFLKGEVYIYPEILTYYRRFNNRESLSVINAETKARGRHENQYICSSYINCLSKEQFIKIFSKYMQDINAEEDKEILCEKVILLWNRGVYLARYGFAEILEDKECRQLLEKKYQMDLNRFYKLNALTMNFES